MYELPAPSRAPRPICSTASSADPGARPRRTSGCFAAGPVLDVRRPRQRTKVTDGLVELDAARAGVSQAGCSARGDPG